MAEFSNFARSDWLVTSSCVFPKVDSASTPEPPVVWLPQPNQTTHSQMNGRTSAAAPDLVWMGSYTQRVLHDGLISFLSRYWLIHPRENSLCT